jgi:shikimate dehydrogenase
VAQSRSPAFQNAALRSAGIPLSYEALDVLPADLAGTLRRLVGERAAGNVTAPHKARVAEMCADLTPLARRTGAVNTFWTAGGALHGDNTDVGGVSAAVRELLGGEPDDLEIALLGAGGAAAAVLAAAESWSGCSVRVHARTPGRAAALCARFPSVAKAGEDLGVALAGARLAINATPVGMLDDSMPVPVEALAPGAAVLDLVYRADETAWVRAARARGHPARDGLTMLVEQGALAFERWFGITPDRKAMWSALR